VNLILVAFSRMWGGLHGQVFAIFVITDAAAEAAVGLGILIAFFRNKETGEYRRSEFAEVVEGQYRVPRTESRAVWLTTNDQRTCFFLTHIWLIPLLPAIGAAIMFFFGRKLQKATGQRGLRGQHRAGFHYGVRSGYRQ